jgi:hypothetical protein
MLNAEMTTNRGDGCRQAELLRHNLQEDSILLQKLKRCQHLAFFRNDWFNETALFARKQQLIYRELKCGSVGHD